jgi:DNA-binding transcriptional LysR family regulator
MHDLAGFDSNLLIVLELLLRERSVSRAAKELGVTQSAVSHALARLRKMFGDPLLTRRGNGMARTPVAEGLQPRVQAAVRSIREVVNPSPGFAPSEARGRLRLGLDGWGLRVFGAQLGCLLRTQAPGIRVRTEPGPAAGGDRNGWQRCDGVFTQLRPASGFRALRTWRQTWRVVSPPWGDGVWVRLAAWERPKLLDGLCPTRLRPVFQDLESWQRLGEPGRAAVPQAVATELLAQGWTDHGVAKGIETEHHLVAANPPLPLVSWLAARLEIPEVS